MPFRPLPVHCSLPLLAATLLLATTLVPSPASAAWPSDSTTNVVLTTGPGWERLPMIVSDGGALGGRTGALVAYTQYPGGGSTGDVYAQHVLADGRIDPAWPASGLAVCTLDGHQEAQALVTDGHGGAIVIWADGRTAGNGWDLYAHHVLARGALDPAWPATGLPVSAVTLNQWYAAAVPDGSGGAVVVWQDERGGAPNIDIFANHVLASGSIDGLWPANGRVVCNATSVQQRPVATSDGAGGVIAAWIDGRAGNNDIYAQRMIVGTSLPAWTTNGVALCTQASAQSNVRIATDGSGGAIVAWDDLRNNVVTGTDIYAQHVTSAGAVDAGWVVDGCIVAGRYLAQQQSQVLADGTGGAFVLYMDYEFSPAGELTAQHLQASGALDPLWTSYGVWVSGNDNGVTQQQLVSDGAGGLIACWADARSGGMDIYAQRVLAGGATDPRWRMSGVAVSTAANLQMQPALLAVDDGDAIAVWADYRTAAIPRIYAQRLSGFGARGTTAPVIADVLDVPNDQGGKLRVLWEPSAADVASIAAIGDYRLWRRLLIGGATYWEFLAQVPARGAGGYAFMAPTTSDSTSAGVPWNTFKVTAHPVSGIASFASAPDSGYSVDNLAPMAPQQLAGEFAAGTTSLTWTAVADHDVAAYRVYRGDAADFAVGPATRVAEVPGTSFADAAGAPRWYRVGAVDVHGNEGATALLAPAAVTGAGPPGTPGALAMSPPRPNPARDAAEFEIALPYGASVSVAVYDVGGRLVRGMLDAPLPAGTHRLAWDTADDHGSPVAGGLYFLRLEVAGARLVRRLAVLR